MPNWLPIHRKVFIASLSIKSSTFFHFFYSFSNGTIRFYVSIQVFPSLLKTLKNAFCIRSYQIWKSLKILKQLKHSGWQGTSLGTFRTPCNYEMLIEILSQTDWLILLQLYLHFQYFNECVAFSNNFICQKTTMNFKSLWLKYLWKYTNYK